MCIALGCTPQIIFVTLSQFELCHFWWWGGSTPKRTDIGYHVNSTTPTILAGPFFKALQVFLSRSEDIHEGWL